MLLCPRCRRELPVNASFCPTCGAAVNEPQAVVPVLEAVAAEPPTKPEPMPVVLPAGKWHSPLLAGLFAILIPGAGQAYNGRPIRGFFLFFLSPLVLPYLISIGTAYINAKRIAGAGGRVGRGGLLWVFLHFWLAVNVALLALIVLTIAGVIS